METASTFDEKLSGRWGTGNKLLAAAWFVEINAAAIGVFIAILTIYGANQQVLDSGNELTIVHRLNSFLGGLPFLMVAVVELCKIPLATAYFHAGTRFWRRLFLIAILLLMAITFETMLNGFERFISESSLAITTKRDALLRIDKGIEDKQNLITTLSGLTEPRIRDEATKAVDEIEKNENAEINRIDQELDKLRVSSFSGDEKLISAEIKRIDNQIKKLPSELKAEIKEVKTRFNEEREKITTNLKNLDEQIRNSRAEEEKQVEKEGFFFETTIRERFTKRRVPLLKQREDLVIELKDLPSVDNRIKEIKQRFEVQGQRLKKERKELNEQLGRKKTATKKQTKPIEDDLRNKKKAIIEKAKKDKLKVYARRDGQLKNLTNSEAQIRTLNEELKRERETRISERAALASLAKDNQVYRVTTWWTGDRNPADMEQWKINLTSWLWFGSIAAITAWTGTVLAFGGLVVKYQHRDLKLPSEGKGFLGKLFGTFRRLLVDLRKRSREPKIKIVENEITKTVEITKEIPVDKVVFKDVPVEVIRKELIHVPVYSNDPELLGHPYKDPKA